MSSEFGISVFKEDDLGNRNETPHRRIAGQVSRSGLSAEAADYLDRKFHTKNCWLGRDCDGVFNGIAWECFVVGCSCSCWSTQTLHSESVQQVTQLPVENFADFATQSRFQRERSSSMIFSSLTSSTCSRILTLYPTETARSCKRTAQRKILQSIAKVWSHTGEWGVPMTRLSSDCPSGCRLWTFSDIQTSGAGVHDKKFWKLSA